MKKLFISCPTVGRTEENVADTLRKMHKMAEIIFDQKLEVIPSTIIRDLKEDNLLSLSRRIFDMASADYFIGPRGYFEAFKSCNFEKNAARQYNIPYAEVDVRRIAPDAWEIEKNYINDKYPVQTKNAEEE